MKKTLKAIVHCQQDWDKNLQFSIFPFSMDSAGYAFVKEIEVEVEIPDDYSPVPDMVAALKKQAELAKQALAQRLMEIDDEIQKLLCIDHTPAVTVPIFEEDEADFPF